MGSPRHWILLCVLVFALSACSGTCPRPETPVGLSGDSGAESAEPELVLLSPSGAEDPALWGSFVDESSRFRLSVTDVGSVRIAVPGSESQELRVNELVRRAEDPPDDASDDDGADDTSCYLGGDESLIIRDVVAWDASGEGEWVVTLFFEHNWDLTADYGLCGGVISEEERGQNQGAVYIDVVAGTASLITTATESTSASRPPNSVSDFEHSCYDELPEVPWTMSWTILCTRREISEAYFTDGSRDTHENVNLERFRYECIEGVGCEVRIEELDELSAECQSPPPIDPYEECSQYCDELVDDESSGSDSSNSTDELAPEDRGFVDNRRGRGWGDRCFRHLQAGRYAAARAACRRGLEIADHNAVIGALHFNLGRVAEEEGNIEEARAAYRRSLEARPNHRVVQRRLDGL